MKIEWLVLLISAITDFAITAATALGTAITTAPGQPLTRNTIILVVTGGVVAFGRTIQQALKANPVTTAALKGNRAPVVVPATATTPQVIHLMPEKTPTGGQP